MEDPLSMADVILGLPNQQLQFQQNNSAGQFDRVTSEQGYKSSLIHVKFTKMPHLTTKDAERYQQFRSHRHLHEKTVIK